MGAITNSIPTWLADAIRKKFGITTFVETGLGQGTSALWAERHFEKCFSIETNPIYIEKFLNEQRQSNVMIVGGGSEYKLVEIVRALSTPALFWLDGHTDDYTPILTEIAAINASPLGHIIMMDDLRLFGQLPAWPTWSQLITLARDSGRRDTFEIDDVLIASPFALSKQIREIIQKG